MAIWKKVIVSGSSAELAALKVDNLTSGQVVIGGGSAGNLTTTAINGTGNIVATTNATNLVHSGSFSGSFTGDLTSVLGASSQPNFVAYNISTGKFTYAGTGSFTAATASYITSSNVFGPFGSNSILTASFATTASFVQNAQTASFVQNAVSASFASTASFVQNAVSASFASTASSVNTLNQAVTVNGTLTVTPSGGQEFLVTSTGVRIGDVSTDVHTVTGSLNVSGSVVITGSLQATSITASIFGTSSFATSASFATTASFASTASFVQNAVSASFVTTASFASTAAQVNNALTFGLGISSSAATYNGSTAVTFHVSGSSNLSNNIIPKWNGTGFTNSNVTDTGTQVQIGAGATSGLSVAAGGINVTGNSTFNSNLTVTGDLTVNGTASFVNSTNLYVKDQFITINSGSSTLADSGIISQYNTAGSGSAFFLEAGSAGTYGRWAVAYDLIGTSTSATADEFMVTAKINQASNPVAAPTWGSTGNGSGNMWVTNAGDIFIYA